MGSPLNVEVMTETEEHLTAEDSIDSYYIDVENAMCDLCEHSDDEASNYESDSDLLDGNYPVRYRYFHNATLDDNVDRLFTPEGSEDHGKMGDYLADLMSAELTQGAPYPGDLQDGEFLEGPRFCVYRTTEDCLVVMDQLLDEDVLLPVRIAESQEFHTARWYAVTMTQSRAVRVPVIEPRWYAERSRMTEPNDNATWRLSENKPFAVWCAEPEWWRDTHRQRFIWQAQLGRHLERRALELLWDTELGEEFIFPSCQANNYWWNVNTWYRRHLRRRLQARHDPEPWYLCDLRRLFADEGAVPDDWSDSEPEDDGWETGYSHSDWDDDDDFSDDGTDWPYDIGDWPRKDDRSDRWPDDDEDSGLGGSCGTDESSDDIVPEYLSAFGVSTQTTESLPSVQRNAAITRDPSRVVPTTITVTVLIDGKPARALIDTGSLCDFMSSTLADQLKLK